MLLSTAVSAQEAFNGRYYCEELKATLQLDLTDAKINLPDLDFYNAYGVLTGNINGTWVALKVKKADNKKAVVRMISDMGADGQDVELTINKDNNLEMRLIDEHNIKTIEGRKYVKLPKVSVFVKSYK